MLRAIAMLVKFGAILVLRSFRPGSKPWSSEVLRSFLRLGARTCPDSSEWLTLRGPTRAQYLTSSPRCCASSARCPAAPSHLLAAGGAAATAMLWDSKRRPGIRGEAATGDQGFEQKQQQKIRDSRWSVRVRWSVEVAVVRRRKRPAVIGGGDWRREDEEEESRTASGQENWEK